MPPRSEALDEPERPGIDTPEVAQRPSRASRARLVPAGTYWMGSHDPSDDARPRHQVRVTAFEIDETEITVDEYTQCVRAGACVRTPPAGSPDAPVDVAYCNYDLLDRRRHPINCVSWYEAAAYCVWASGRLPTEEEWEYAARGTDGRTYPWGSAHPDSRACRARGYAGTCEVGSFATGDSPFGLKDMAGNVYEWTASRYCSYSNKGCANRERVARGGGWKNPASASKERSTVRWLLDPAYRSSELGFRCAR